MNMEQMGDKLDHINPSCMWGLCMSLTIITGIVMSKDCFLMERIKKNVPRVSFPYLLALLY